MHKSFIALVAVLLGLASCKDKEVIGHKSIEVSKPVEVVPTKPENEHEFAELRSRFEMTTRERLSKIDLRIQELEAEATATAQDAVAMLRARRDQLASRLDTARVQAKSSWDKFETDLTHAFDDLERDLDDALRRGH